MEAIRKDELIFRLYAKEAEVAVLGTLLMFEDALGEVMPVLKGEMFYEPRHQWIYEAIVKVDAQGAAVDLVAVGEALKAGGRLEGTGGYAYLSELTNASGRFAMVGFYARVIAQRYVQRELLRFGAETARRAQEDSGDVADMIAATGAELDRIAGALAGNARMRSIGELAEESVAGALERERRRKEGRTSGVTTGLREFDRMTSGMKGGQLVILAGRPGSGKTSVMLNMMKAAAGSGCPVCAFSLEMTGVSLADRLVMAGSGVAAGSFRRGEFTAENYERMAAAKRELQGLPVYIDDRAGVSMQYVRATARMMAKRGMCGAVFIDYLQLLDSRTERKYNREQEVAQLSGQAKRLAKELGVPVVLLSQLNRDCEKRADKKPELADLRESGAIEQDADVVLLVYRPEYYGLKTMDGEPIKHVGKLIVAKQRDGAVGEVKFAYNESLTRIGDFNDKLPF